MIEVVVLVIVGVLVFPWLVYMTAKLASFGWLRGRQLFRKQFPEEK